MPGMKWIEPLIFFKKFRKPCLQTDEQTDGQTSGWIQYTPISPSVERGYNNVCTKVWCHFSIQWRQWRLHWRFWIIIISCHGDYFSVIVGLKYYAAFGRVSILSERILAAELRQHYHHHHDVIKWQYFPRSWPFLRGNSPVTGEFPTQRPVTRNFDAFHCAHYDVTVMNVGFSMMVHGVDPVSSNSHRYKRPS